MYYGRIRSKEGLELRRFLYPVLIIAMVLGTAFTALGAWGGTLVNPSFSDIAGHPAEHDLTALAALGIYEGYLGQARPDDPITRAEFCKVVVTAVGRGGLAAGVTGLEPPFTDGASVPAWAWGYVNVAAYMGLIHGYPDGSFGPGKGVTYAEAVTMLIRAIPGHAAQVPPGIWPYNYLFHGVDSGFTGSVDVGFANLEAARGDVARLIFATMFVPQLDRDGEEKAGTELLHGRWAHEVLTGIDLAAGTLNGYVLGSKIYLLGGGSLEDLRQLDVEFIFDTAGAGRKVVFVAPYTHSGIVDGTFASLDTNAASHNIIVLADGTETLYDSPATVNVVLNGVTGKVVGDLAVGGSDKVVITLDEHDHAVNVVASREDFTNDILVAAAAHEITDPAGTDGSIDILGHSSYYVLAGAGITLDGATVALSDLKPDDILYIGTLGVGGLGSHIWSIRAIRNMVEGTRVSERTVYPGEKHYVTLRLADGTEREYRYLFGAGYHNGFGGGFPANGKFALNADGAIVYAAAYGSSSEYVYVKNFMDIHGTTSDTVTVDIRGTEVSFTTNFNFGTAGYVGKLGKLIRDPATNVVTGFEPAFLVGYYDILSVDDANGTMTIEGASVEFVTDPIVYKWQESTGTYSYVPLKDVSTTWELCKDVVTGSKLYATGPMDFSGVLNVEQGTVYETIQDAVANASSGDHLLVSPGVYTVSSASPLTIGTTVHLASAVPLAAEIELTAPITVNAAGTTITGFSIDHNFTPGASFSVTATGVTIADCAFDAWLYRGDINQVTTRHFSIGVHGFASGLTVTGNSFQYYGSGVFLENGAGGTVTGNRFGNVYYGFATWHETLPTSFTGNRFVAFCNYPIVVNAPGSTFTGNVWEYIGVYYFYEGGAAYAALAYDLDAIRSGNTFLGTTYVVNTGFSREIREVP